MDESARNADGALGAASPRRLQPGPAGKRRLLPAGVTHGGAGAGGRAQSCLRIPGWGHTPGSSGGWQRAEQPAHLRLGSLTGELRRAAESSRARTSPGSPGSGRGAALGAAQSALGNAPARCHGARSILGRGDNNKERIWVTALAALCRGLAGPAAAGAGVSCHPSCAEGGERSRGNGGPALSPLGRGAFVSGPAQPLPTTGSAAGDKGVTRPNSFPEDG